MTLSSKWVVLAAVLALASAASEARAANVAQPQGQRLTQGWVIGVHRVNGQPTFRVRTAGMNNQAALAANQNGLMPGAQKPQTFFVGPGTRFEAARGTGFSPASIAALRSGQRVLIASQGPQAIRVRIFPRNQYAGRARRSRTAGYPSGSRHASHTAAPQTSSALGPMLAMQGTTPPANHHAHNASAGATHFKSRK